MSLKDTRKAAEDYVTDLFLNNPDDRLIYHNLEHTRKVVAHTTELAMFYKLDEERRFVVETAAWFHDTGYIFKGPAGHEEESVRIMEQFILPDKKVSGLAITIAQCILTTKRSTYPVLFSEKILCDADTYHFGSPEFRQTDLLVKKEIELLTGSKTVEWTKHTITMLEKHQFYTGYCKERLEAGKAENLAWLRSLL